MASVANSQTTATSMMTHRNVNASKKQMGENGVEEDDAVDAGWKPLGRERLDIPSPPSTANPSTITSSHRRRNQTQRTLSTTEDLLLYILSLLISGFIIMPLIYSKLYLPYYAGSAATGNTADPFTSTATKPQATSKPELLPGSHLLFEEGYVKLPWLNTWWGMGMALGIGAGLRWIVKWGLDVRSA